MNSATTLAAATPPADATESGDTRSALPIRQITTTPLGRYVVELENGEVWRQLDSDDTPVAIPSDTTGLTATIKRTLFGAHKLTISGSGRAFKVSRVK